MGAPRYRDELLDRVEMVTRDLAWSVEDTELASLTIRPRDSEWSIHEHLSHLRDMEREVILPLLRWAAVPDMLGPRPYSRREWRRMRYDEDEPAASVLADVQRIRDEELAILREMPLQRWEAYLTGSSLGPVTCEWIAELMYRHALDHLQSMMALRQEWTLARRAQTAVVIGASA